MKQTRSLSESSRLSEYTQLSDMTLSQLTGYVQISHRQDQKRWNIRENNFILISTLDRRQSKTLILSTNVDQKRRHIAIKNTVSKLATSCILIIGKIQQLEWLLYDLGFLGCWKIICKRGKHCHILIIIHTFLRSGSVVECLTRDRGATGSSLTGVTALWSLSKTHLS